MTKFASFSLPPHAHPLQQQKNETPARADGPNGRWRGGLFDCFQFGVCHPVVLNSLLFPQSKPMIGRRNIYGSWMYETPFNETPCSLKVVLAQTWTRFYRLTNKDLTAGLFGPFRMQARMLLLLTAGFIGVNILLVYLYATAPHPVLAVVVMGLIVLFDVPIIVIFLHLVIQTRIMMRQHYHIPDGSCAGLENPLVSVLCTCCTVSQMSRHTLDPSCRATWFTETGLSPQVEASIVSPSF